MERLVYIDRHAWQCTPLDVMHSYLSEQAQVITVDIYTSRYVDLYCLGLDDIFKRHQIQYHMYADDTQLYATPRHDETTDVIFLALLNSLK